jgi:hypothetical protein
LERVTKPKMSRVWFWLRFTCLSLVIFTMLGQIYAADYTQGWSFYYYIPLTGHRDMESSIKY